MKTRRPNIYCREPHFCRQQEQMCGQRQSSHTPNSTTARRNWRRRLHSSCRLDSQCNSDRDVPRHSKDFSFSVFSTHYTTLHHTHTHARARARTHTNTHTLYSLHYTHIHCILYITHTLYYLHIHTRSRGHMRKCTYVRSHALVRTDDSFKILLWDFVTKT